MSSRDRWLAGLFALQLLAAAVLGGVLVHALDDKQTTTVVSGPATATAGPVPSAGGGTKGTAARPAGPPPPRRPTAAGTAPSPRRRGARRSSRPVRPSRSGPSSPRPAPSTSPARAQATKAYFDIVNRAGGVNGHKIVLDLRDDQLDSARRQAAGAAAGRRGVFAFTAWRAPLTENDIVPFLAQNKIPLIGAYGEQEEYHSPYAFLMSASVRPLRLRDGPHAGGAGREEARPRLHHQQLGGGGQRPGEGVQGRLQEQGRHALRQQHRRRRAHEGDL